MTTPDGAVITADVLPLDLADVVQASAGPWVQWWDLVDADPVLGPILRSHPRDELPHGDHLLSVHDHIACAEQVRWQMREVWRAGTSAVLRADKAS